MNCNKLIMCSDIKIANECDLNSVDLKMQATELEWNM